MKRDKRQEKFLIKTWLDEDFQNKRDQDIKDGLKMCLSMGLVVGLVLIMWLFMFKGCAMASEPDNRLQASWYSESSLLKEGTWTKNKHSLMANGQKFDENALTCATRLYPLGSQLLITNLNNNKTVLVTVTDRIGKRFAKTRIDLSRGSFERIANLEDGLIPIKAQIVTIKVKGA